MKRNLILKFLWIGIGWLSLAPFTGVALAEGPEPPVGQVVSTGTEIFWLKDMEAEGRAGPAKTGWASWYGRRFHGRRTANGERYNQHAFTCASRTLPFGTVLEITNLKNGRSALVRVNDRGPYRRRRVLDVSYAVAKKLGFLKQGVAKVAYRVLQ